VLAAAVPVGSGVVGVVVVVVVEAEAEVGDRPSGGHRHSMS
jgi:hypothetical protein